jgi:hypothetical protein
MTLAPTRRRGRATLAGLFLLALLALLAAIGAVRVARHASAARVELGRLKLAAVDAPTRAELAALADRVQVNYYVSRRDALPSHMRAMEQRVRDICEALRAAAPERFDFQIVDPSSHPDFERFAAKRKASPVRVRSIERDNYSERTVWSTLTISYGAHAPAVINGLLPDHLPRLQARILAQIEELERPRRPIAIIAGSASTSELAAALAEDAGARRGAEVRRFEMSSSLPLPLEGDVLFWLDPAEVAPARLRELEGWLASGRSIVVAGALRRVAPTVRDGRPSLLITDSGFPAEALYSHFGLEPRPGLYLDTNCEKLEFDGAPREVPTLVRCIAPAQDFHTFVGQPNGTLLFHAPTPIALDGARLEALGWRAELLATTSDKTWTQPLPAASGGQPLGVALDALAPERGEPAPKQALVVALRPNDATQGLLVACAASTPFVDGTYKREATAHWRFVRTLMDTLCGGDRLVQNRVGVLRPEPIPELGASARVLWRAFCLFLLPALLLALAFARGAGARTQPTVPSHARRALLPRAVALRLVAGLALVVGATALASFADARVDLSEDGLNQLAPHSREIAAQARAVRAELCFSAPDRLPPALRTDVARLVETVRAFRRAGADLTIESLEPDAADRASREALAARGFTPLDVSTRDEEVTTVRTVYSALRLSSGSRSELLRFPDPESFEQAEFRVAFALWRLRTGKSPSIAFASDTPRMSAAEEYDQQQAGLFAARAGDVYQVARELLARNDFVVLHVNPREPRMPPDADALVWLQPRRTAEPMLEALITHLHRGGKALLAAQHFVMLSHQFPGLNYTMQYWPRPESCDVERHYFPGIGIELVREPFFDALNTRVELESRARKSASENVFAMESALPFLVRVAAANFEPGAALLRGVGDQAFLFPSFFRLDAAKLAAAGLEARPLMWSSDRTWSADWRGGRFNGPILAWPPGPEKIGPTGALEPVLRGRVPLAIDVRGQFAYPEKRLQEELYAIGADGRQESRPAPPWPSAAEDPGSPGRLVFFGCSELFKNYRLQERDFRGDQLLLNTVASLALPPELAALATRRKVERGFGLVEPGRKLWWRNVVVGTVPLALVAIALARALREARASRSASSKGAVAA